MVMLYVGEASVVAVALPWCGEGRTVAGVPRLAAVDDAPERIGGLVIEVARSEPTEVSEEVSSEAATLRKAIGGLLGSPGKDAQEFADWVLIVFGPKNVKASFGGRVGRRYRTDGLGQIFTESPDPGPHEVGELVASAREAFERCVEAAAAKASRKTGAPPPQG
jgi:hypothetical protein